MYYRYIINKIDKSPNFGSIEAEKAKTVKNWI